ncbi:peptidylprolyl isomerase [Wenzhouxiangella marina]|uniref:peptidylprolyl isomerase n=1 Tax=Wenzhouxiangella marina TaxID=1579979 RepID=A0A0K0XWM8_9GAMM|nr:peptidylprolyl isomerase [Wenzhouxiangella marina]AKS42021.1 hypothetical protein WM2015_1651 [Wenzhouxiangella marina]MBB6086211.1 peptidyl-prolyl cis-trans isomerase C [Wenzhouxiangella marina]
MKFKLLICISIFALVACQGESSEERPSNPLISEDDVLLVLVDGEPITLPMLEYTMEARGISEDDEEGMRRTLDELIRLQAVANAAQASGLADEARVRAHRRLRDLETLQMRYFGQLAEEDPVTEAQIEAAYRAQVERTGDRQFQIETIIYTNQEGVLRALERIEAGETDFDQLAAEARGFGLTVDQPLWVDLSQLPPDAATLLATAEVGDVLAMPLQTPQGWRAVRVSDVRENEIPELDEVRQGIIRSLARQRVEQRVDALYEAAEITPMLPLDGSTGTGPAQDD